MSLFKQILTALFNSQTEEKPPVNNGEIDRLKKELAKVREELKSQVHAARTLADEVVDLTSTIHRLNEQVLHTDGGDNEDLRLAKWRVFELETEQEEVLQLIKDMSDEMHKN